MCRPHAEEFGFFYQAATGPEGPELDADLSERKDTGGQAPGVGQAVPVSDPKASTVGQSAGGKSQAGMAIELQQVGGPAQSPASPTAVRRSLNIPSIFLSGSGSSASGSMSGGGPMSPRKASQA